MKEKKKRSYLCSPGVETSETFFPCDPSESGHKTRSESGLGNQSNSGSLKRTQSDIGKELGNGGSSEVDGLSVFTSAVNTKGINGGLFPELVTGEENEGGLLGQKPSMDCSDCRIVYNAPSKYSPSELQGTLQGVTQNGGTETGKKGTSTFLGNDLSETTNHTLQECLNQESLDEHEEQSF